MTQNEYLELIDKVNKSGKYSEDWQSLSRHKTPEWYTNGKFGIFIHWGIYSVPAFGNEWYPREMYDKKKPAYYHHRKKYGPQDKFGYKDFIPYFKGEKFDAGKWVELFKNAGAKFVMPVCEHHDGFAMYDTQFSRWKATEMGPKRDVIGEIREACDKNGLVFCGSYHRAEHYFFMNNGRIIDSDVNDKEYEDFYGPAVYSPEYASMKVAVTTEDTYAEGPSEKWLKDWTVRTCELIDKYRPQLLYFDWWIHNHAFKPYLKKICAYYYNRAEEWGKEVSIDYKHHAFPPGTATFDVERGGLKEISPVPWQTDTAIGKFSWGYRRDNVYKNSRQLITDLIDTVSKNGMLMLNVGPKPDGTITREETKVLLEIGQWLKMNGEGIYGTTFWTQFGEGKVNSKDGFFKDNKEKPYKSGDFRFTYKDGFVYAFQMNPDGKDVRIKAFKKHVPHDFLVDSVTLLETGETLDFERNKNEMVIHTYGYKTGYPLCFKIKID